MRRGGARREPLRSGLDADDALASTVLAGVEAKHVLEESEVGNESVGASEEGTDAAKEGTEERDDGEDGDKENDRGELAVHLLEGQADGGKDADPPGVELEEDRGSKVEPDRSRGLKDERQENEPM